MVADGPGVIEVLDNGPGFEAGRGGGRAGALLPRRAGGSQGPQGTGLGLSFASELAAQWAGRISVGNRAGGGARVTLTLPVDDKGPQS